MDDLYGLLAAEYDFSELSGFDKLGVQFYYLHNPDAKNRGGGGRPYRHSYSISSDFENGGHSFLAQLILGSGFGTRPDVWGGTLMPARSIYEERLQLVTRYQFASSDGADGLQLQHRYERQVPNLSNKGLGDHYQAACLGLNYYIYGNRLKLMTGIEYPKMGGSSHGGDYSGWSGFGGLRLIF